MMALYFFTPLGFRAKVFINRLVSHNSIPVDKRTDLVLEDYDFDLEDINGNVVNLDDYKGEVLFINFWASWCPPCVAEMPDLQLLNDAYGDKVNFFFIARDKKDKVSKFLNKTNYVLPVYFEASFTPKAIYSGTLPTTFIIGKNGNIVTAQTGSANWNGIATRTILDNLLAE